MTSLRLTSLGAALALTVLAGAGAAHAAVPAGAGEQKVSEVDEVV